jgi:COMPASS component SWD2
LLNVSGRPTIAFDPSGLTFAVGLNSNTIKIYDVKTFDKGPFATWTLSDHQSPQGFPTWTSLKFTNDGKNILITTVGNTHYLVDAFEGHLKQRFEGHIGLQSPDNGGCDAGLSPDGRFVFAGTVINMLGYGIRVLITDVLPFYYLYRIARWQPLRMGY